MLGIVAVLVVIIREVEQSRGVSELLASCLFDHFSITSQALALRTAPTETNVMMPADFFHTGLQKVA